MRDRGVKLRVGAAEGRVRRVVDDDVRLDAAALDQPDALVVKDSVLARARQAAVDGGVA
jgi:hypothetical protein